MAGCMATQLTHGLTQVLNSEDKITKTSSPEEVFCWQTNMSIN